MENVGSCGERPNVAGPADDAAHPNDAGDVLDKPWLEPDRHGEVCERTERKECDFTGSGHHPPNEFEGGVTARRARPHDAGLFGNRIAPVPGLAVYGRKTSRTETPSHQRPARSLEDRHVETTG